MSAASPRRAASGALALCLLLSTSPAAFAGGSHNGGVRRGPPPPPPTTPSAPAPPSAPQAPGRSPAFAAPPVAPRNLAPAGALAPGRANLPPRGLDRTTSLPSTGSVPTLPRPGSVGGAPPAHWTGASPRSLPGAAAPSTSGVQPRYVGPTTRPSQPDARGIPTLRPTPTPTLSALPSSRPAPQPLAERSAEALARLRQGGVRTGSNPRLGVAPTSPPAGTAPSPRWDRGPLAPPSVSSSGHAGLRRSPPSTGADAPTYPSTIRPRTTSPLRTPALPAPTSTPTTAPTTTFRGAAPATGLATHTGGVRRGSGAGSLGARPYPYAPAVPTHGHPTPTPGGSTWPGHGWGYAPRPSAWGPVAPAPVVLAPVHNDITVVNIWGFAPPVCHEPALPLWPEPSWSQPVWPQPAPVVEPPAYAPPTYLPPTYGDPAPAPWPAPAPAPIAPPIEPPVEPPAEPPVEPPVEDPLPGPVEEPSAGDAPALDEETLRAAFASILEAFRRGAYAEALDVAEALTASEPRLGEAWMAALHAAFALGRYDRAARALTEAALLGAFPRGYRFDPRPLYPEEAVLRAQVEALAARVAAAADDADARLVQAWLLTALGQRAQAQEALVAVLTLRPDDRAAPLLALALLPAAPASPAEAPAAAPADGLVAPAAPSTVPSAPSARPLPVEER